MISATDTAVGSRLFGEGALAAPEDRDYQETLVTLPPDGGWGWAVVAAAFLCFFVVDGSIFSFGVFLDGMADELGCPKSKVAVCAAISTGVFCLSGPFAASLVNNYGYRKVGVAGSLISMLSYLTTALSESIHLIYFTNGVMSGLGMSLVYMPAVIAVGFYFERRRGIATGIASCGSGLGGAALPVLLTIAHDNVETTMALLIFVQDSDVEVVSRWRKTFKMMSGLFAVSAFCAIIFRPIPPSYARKIRYSTVASGKFFATYPNRMYPTLSEVTEVPTITLLQPRKLTKSSEVMIMSYPSSSVKCKFKEDEIQEGSTRTLETCVEGKAVEKGTKSLLVSKKKRKKISLHETQTLLGSNMRPMYRDDIFYNSSFNIIRKNRKTAHQDSKLHSNFSQSNMDYHLSVIRVETSWEFNSGKRCFACADAVKRTLATMLDYKLLKSPTFLLIACHASFLCFGYSTTFIFMKDRAEQMGVSRGVSSWLISILGVSNTIGRISYGLMANWPRIEFIWLTVVCLVIGGMATILSAHFRNDFMQICYAAAFGGLVACIPALRTLIIVDTLGLDKLTNSIGLILMFQGVTSLIGIIMAGLLRDLTGDYKWSFYFSGICIILSALFCIPLNGVAIWEQNKNNIKS